MTIKLGTNDLAGLASSNSDNISITHNSSNKLQTIGIINQKDTTQSFKTWVGTKAEYDALETKNNDTIYNVTDDGNVNQSILEMIYPVGSIYIGTMNICPLSALFGTWEKVSSGRVLQGADENHLPGTTVEAGLPSLSLYTPNSSEKYGSEPNTVYNVGSTSGNTNNIIMTVQTDKLYVKDDNNIVGNSNTVQPPALCVNIWQRIA